MTVKTKTNLVDQIINGLRDTATDLEELRVQIALGKAEMKDLFETLKKKLHNEIHESKSRLKQLEKHPSLLPLVNALEHLQIQLNLGYAESKEIFEEQRKKIETSLNELETRLEAGIPQESLVGIQINVERFRSKLKLVALGYKLKKLSLEYSFGLKEAELENKLKEIKQDISNRIQKASVEWHDIKGHIKDSAGDLRHLLLS